MNTFVIDASVAIKWVVEEPGTAEALALLRTSKLMAPELLVPECANVLWKKAQRKEILQEQAWLAARLLQAAEIEIRPTRSLLERTTRLAIEFDHPAYDCLYIALAVENDCPFVTADEQLLRKTGRTRREALRGRAISLAAAAAVTGQ